MPSRPVLWDGAFNGIQAFGAGAIAKSAAVFPGKSIASKPVMPSTVGSNAVPVEEVVVRKAFPESWLWSNMTSV